MARRLPVSWLLVAGCPLVAAGLGLVVIGTWLSAWLYGLLPTLIIDADAVGGAAAASGYLLLGLGVAHLAAARLLQRGVAGALIPITVLCAVMMLLAFGWGVAALVSSASRGGPPALLVPAGIGLCLVAAAYAWTARAVIGLRQVAGRPG